MGLIMKVIRDAKFADERYIEVLFLARKDLRRLVVFTNAGHNPVGVDGHWG